MAWPRTQSAEEILGMKPEDLKSKLESAATKDDLKALTDSNDALKGTLAQITESLKALTTPKPEVKPNLEDQVEPAVALLSDPTKFVADQTKTLQAQTLETQAQLAEMRARQSNQWSNVFAQYGTEIVEKASKSYNSATRANPGFWDFFLQQFVGEKFVKGEITPASYPSLLGTSSVAPNADGSSKDPNMGFNADMAAWFKERNVPLDKAAKIKTLMVDHGEPINHANFYGKAPN